MATDPVAPAAPPAPQANPGKGAVIRLTADARESRAERLLKKQLPALVVSGVVHVALIGTMIASDTLMARPPVEKPSEALLTVVAPNEEDPTQANLTNPDEGLDASVPAAIEG